MREEFGWSVSGVESVDSGNEGPLQLARQKISPDCFIVPSGSIRWSTGPSVLITVVLAKGRRRGEANGLIIPVACSFEASSGPRDVLATRSKDIASEAESTPGFDSFPSLGADGIS